MNPRTDLRDVLRANLFDGDEGGTITMPIASLLTDVVEIVEEWARAARDSAGTICKCGLAKSYHAARFGQREHEYEPRYPAARDSAGLTELRAALGEPVTP